MNFIEKLKSRMTELSDSMVAAVADKIASPEIREEREVICNSCEFKLAITSQCKKCGCFIASKVSLNHSECPVGKWHPVIIEKNI
jgi:hypothetical protein